MSPFNELYFSGRYFYNIYAHRANVSNDHNAFITGVPRLLFIADEIMVWLHGSEERVDDASRRACRRER